MKHTPQPDPNCSHPKASNPNTKHANAQPRAGRKRRVPNARAADLQARRHHLAYPDTSVGAEPPLDTKPVDDESDARRQRRRRRLLTRSLRPQSLQMWLVLLVVAIVSVGALRKMRNIHNDYRWLQARVDDKKEQLAALKEQDSLAQQRLAVLTSDKGREQLLIEHGYIPPRSRILLFPRDAEAKRAAQIPKNDLSPRPPSTEADANGSLLQQTGKAVGDWWRGLGKTGGDKPAGHDDLPAPTPKSGSLSDTGRGQSHQSIR